MPVKRCTYIVHDAAHLRPIPRHWPHAQHAGAPARTRSVPVHPTLSPIPPRRPHPPCIAKHDSDTALSPSLVRHATLPTAGAVVCHHPPRSSPTRAPRPSAALMRRARPCASPIRPGSCGDRSASPALPSSPPRALRPSSAPRRLPPSMACRAAHHAHAPRRHLTALDRYVAPRLHPPHDTTFPSTVRIRSTRGGRSSYLPRLARPPTRLDLRHRIRAHPLDRCAC
ncbi:hypothetical protein B0H14DRAFT_3430432 [Mycena olivaceomarginata]|nr:hypothetical protein B0H14DRAFT_3430432 [Mycena olivaceomarginata]